jgi:hypothetical protein
MDCEPVELGDGVEVMTAEVDAAKVQQKRTLQRQFLKQNLPMMGR